MQAIVEISGEYNFDGIDVRQPTPGKETEMVRQFISYRKNKFKASSQKHLMVFVEPRINHSYPDIVFVEYNPEKYSNWSPLRSELDKIDYKILYFIYTKGKLEAADIVSGLGTSWKDTCLSLERLYDAKLIYRKLGYWRPRRDNLFGTTKIEAVEAKINKLDNVFKQALQNQSFASESYVLSNLRFNTCEDVYLTKMKKTGVGVYSQGADYQHFKRILHSNKFEIPVSFSSIYFNEWVGKVIHKV